MYCFSFVDEVLEISIVDSYDKPSSIVRCVTTAPQEGYLVLEASAYDNSDLAAAWREPAAYLVKFWVAQLTAVILALYKYMRCGVMLPKPVEETYGRDIGVSDIDPLTTFMYLALYLSY